MTAEALISRLDKVKPTGAGTWLSRCPAHEDNSPSLSVRALDDGRVLLHCFAGCEIEAIVDAIGLKLDALFPPRPKDHLRPLRRPFPAADVLEAVAHEALVVQLAASDLARGAALSEETRARLVLATSRIHEAREIACG